jgi:hypothetical protein
VPDDIHATVHPMEASRLRGLGDSVPPISQPLQLPGRDHPMLPSRQFRQPSMSNPLSFVTHRVTKDAGLRFSPSRDSEL